MIQRDKKIQDISISLSLVSLIHCRLTSHHNLRSFSKLKIKGQQHINNNFCFKIGIRCPTTILFSWLWCFSGGSEVRGILLFCFESRGPIAFDLRSEVGYLVQFWFWTFFGVFRWTGGWEVVVPEWSLDRIWLNFGEEDLMFHLDGCSFGVSGGDVWFMDIVFQWSFREGVCFRWCLFWCVLSVLKVGFC